MGFFRFHKLLVFFWLALYTSLALATTPTLPPGYTSADCTVLYAKFTEHREEGPRIFIKADDPGQRNFDSIPQLTVMQYNVENLFNYQGKFIRDENGRQMISPPKTKPEARWRRLQNNIERANPDIMTWQEVENQQAAEDFVEKQLGGKYKVIMINGNDERGIAVGLLMKKDLPFDVVAQSNRNINASNGERVFSRDFVVTNFLKAGSKESDKPVFTIMNTHNKSQRDLPGDARSVKKRTQQVSAQVQIAKKELSAHPNVPLFITGDMNSDILSAPEFQPMWDAGFKDVFDAAAPGTPKEQRVTHSYFGPGAPPSYSQLDGIFLSPQTQTLGIVKKIEVVADQGADGKPMPLPRNFDEREMQASDHRALRMELDFSKIRSEWQK